MKNIMTAIAATGLCAALLSGCDKRSYDAQTGMNVGTMQQKVIVGTVANMSFTSGVMLTSSITVRQDNELLASVSGTHTWNLFDPYLQSGLTLRPGEYHNLSTTFQLVQGEDGASMHLRGSLTMIDETGVESSLPIDFIITDGLNLRATNTAGLTLGEASNFIDLLQIKLNNLTANITPDMWKRAAVSENGTLLISEKNNPELFGVMFTSFRGMFQTGPFDTNNPSRPVPQHSYESAYR